jgi:hypothetical protein
MLNTGGRTPIERVVMIIYLLPLLLALVVSCLIDML